MILDELTRKGKYKMYSLAYNLSLSPLALDNILNEFTIEEIVSFEENAGVLYQLLKKYPEMLNKINAERIEFFFDELLEEFKINVAITPTVTDIVDKFNIFELPMYIHYVVELIDIAIKNMRKQGFEITPYNISEIDIIGMMYQIAKRIKVSSFDECIDFIPLFVTKENFNYFISEMSILTERQSTTVFEETIFILKSIIEKVESLEIEEIDYDSDEYNPLEEYYISKDDMIKLCYQSININIRNFNEEDTQFFISVIASLLAVNQKDDKIYRICMTILEPLLIHLKQEITQLESNNTPASKIIEGIIDTGYLEYRLSRLLYVTQPRFIVNYELPNPIIIREYFVLRDLKNIEHLYSLWYNSKSTESGDALYEPYLNIDLDKVRKLIPMTDEEISSITIYPIENI